MSNNKYDAIFGEMISKMKAFPEVAKDYEKEILKSVFLNHKTEMDKIHRFELHIYMKKHNVYKEYRKANRVFLMKELIEKMLKEVDDIFTCVKCSKNDDECKCDLYVYEGEKVEDYEKEFQKLLLSKQKNTG